MTASVIDSLVIELGLDPAKFTQGQKEALDSFKRTQEVAVGVGKEIEAQGTKITEYFAGLKREALTILTVFLGGRGIKEFTSYVTGLDAATARLAPQLRLSARELSAWQGAAEQTGGSAQSITGTLSGLSGEMNRFMLTGQTSVLPVLNSLGIGFFNANKEMKSSGEILLEIADHLKGMDPARAAALLSLIPGMNQDTINLLIQGRVAVERYLDAARKAGGTTEESAAAALKYQQNLSLLERSATSLGRALTTVLAPALSTVFTSLTKLFQGWAIAPGSAEDKKQEGALNKKIGNAHDFLLWFGDMIGLDHEKNKAELDKFYGQAPAAASPAAGAAPPRAAASSSEEESYIRRAAIARGIDPDVAVAVAKSEGLNRYVGDQGTSFGPFQLHYKNNIPGLSNGGLGDVFTKQTGLDARDPATWKRQVDFALDEAKKSGWGAWHGWRGLPYAGIGQAGIAAAAGARSELAPQPGNSSSHSTTVTIGKVDVNAPNARNADDIAAEIPEALRRQNWGASANYGQQG